MIWGRYDPQLLANGFHFLEGPRWRQDRLYVSDFFGYTVSTVTEGGQVETLCTVPQRPSGLGFTPDGDLLIVSMLDQRLLRVRDGRPEVVAELGDYAAGPTNDMLVDALGRAYIGNFGKVDSTGAEATDLIMVDPDGQVSVAATGLVFPNGAVLTPDGRELIIAETFAHRITAFTVAPDGRLSDRRVWADFAAAGVTTSVSEPGATVLPDGMALDAEGALWVADARGSGVLRVAEGGEVIDAIPTGDLAVYAVTLGGADRRTIFMCAAPPLNTEDPSQHRHAALLTCRVEVPGAGLP